jgi:hypothetical protein
MLLSVWIKPFLTQFITPIDFIALLWQYLLTDIMDHANRQSKEKYYTGRFIMFSMITNIYNQKTKESTLMELFSATANWKKIFFDK